MHPRRLRCSSLKYSRYCTPPCTTRTVGAPPVGRRAVRYRGPQRGSRAGVVVGAPRPSRCDAGLSPRLLTNFTNPDVAEGDPVAMILQADVAAHRASVARVVLELARFHP